MGTFKFEAKNLNHVTDVQGLLRLTRLLRDVDGVIVADIETTQLSPFGDSARIVCVALTFCTQETADGQQSTENGTVEPQTWVVGLSHPDSGLHRSWRRAMRCLAESLASKQIVAHNASFDLTWIKVHTGIDLCTQLVGDTALSSHLLDENQSAGLKVRAMRTFGCESWLDFDWRALERDQKLDPDGRLLAERVDWYTMAAYCGEDTFWTWHLHRVHSTSLPATEHESDDLSDDYVVQQLRLGRYYRAVGLKTVQALARIEENGFMLDPAWCRARQKDNASVTQKTSAELRKLLLDAQEQMDEGVLPRTEALVEACEYTAAQPENWAPTSIWFQHWAALMCAMGLLRVTDRTATGKPKWAKDVLDRQARQGLEVAGKLRAMRIATVESAYIGSWLDEAQADGRVRASYNYFSVVTGRLSCSGPNLQQVARSAKMAFCAPPGHVLVSADYSQLELRLAAFQARCEPLLSAYRSGIDAHEMMAARVSGDDLAQVTPEQRQAAKAINFGFLFGMGVSKFVLYADATYGVEFTEDQAEVVRKEFFEMWDGLGQWHARQRKRSREDGQVTTPLGRVRRLPSVWGNDEYLRGKAERQAINSPVQGMASDIMCLAAWRVMQYDWIKSVALVHDCLVVECPEDRAEEASAVIRRCMETDVLLDLAELDCRLDVPLVADISISRSWGEK